MKFFARKQNQRVTNFALAALLVVSTLTASVPFIFSQKADAAGLVTVVSTPNSTNGWATQDGAPSYVSGPVGATGNGSLKFQTVTSGNKNNYFHLATGSLSSINNLGYDLYDASGIPASYQLQVTGVNRLDNPSSSFTSLVWEPAYNGGTNNPTSGFVSNTNLENGTWWSSNSIAGAPNRDTFVSLQAIIAANPNAQVVAYGVNVGSGTPNATSYVDNVRFGDMTTNFEVTPPATPTGLRFAEFACGGATNINSITPTWNAAAGAISYNYRATLPDGSVYGPVPVGNVTSINGPFGAEGISSFEVQAVSADGLTSAWSTSCTATYDITAPAPVIVTPGVNEKVAGTTQIKVQTNDINTHYTYLEINQGGVWKAATTLSGTTPTWNFDTTTLSDGNYALKVDTVDYAGNSAEVTRNFKIGNPPVVTGVYPVDGSYVKGTTTFGLTTSDSNLSYTYIEFNKNGNWLNDNTSSVSTALGSTNAGTAPKLVLNTRNYTDGTYGIKIDSVDAQGNVAEKNLSYIVDNTAPVVKITSPVAGNVLHGTAATISGTATDNLSGITSVTLHLRAVKANGSLDGFLNTVNVPVVNGVWSTTINTTQFSDLGEGYGYGITVIGSDAAGNSNGSGASVKVISIDNTAPTINGEGYAQNGNVFTPEFSTNEDLAFLWTADPTNPASATFNSTALNPGFTVTQDGNYHFTLKATDVAGNSVFRTISFTYTAPTSGNAAGSVDGGALVSTGAGASSNNNATNPITPAITSPASAAVLGATTDGTGNGTGAADVKGATDDKTAAAVNSDANQGKIFGLAWYWWILILAALAVIAWFIAAAVRRRGEENA